MKLLSRTMSKARAWTLTFCLAGCVMVAHTDVHASITHLWSQHFGDATTQFARSVATDESGNVIIAGFFRGTVNFGGSNLISVGGIDIFVAKFNGAGVHQWSQRFGDASDQRAFSVATGLDASLFVTGYFSGTVNFGGSDLTSVGSSDIFVVKLTSDGIHKWSQRFGDASAQEAYSLATDESGQVIVTGAFDGTANFGGVNLTSAGAKDIFVAKFDEDGVHQWSKRFGDASDNVARSVATDPFGYVIVAGDFFGTVDFGGGALTSAGFGDIFIVKFDAAGVHQWSKRFGDSFGQNAHGVATNSDSDAIITGALAGTVNFGGSDLTSAGGVDIFVAKFNSEGVHKWSRRYGDASNQTGHSVAADASGNAVVTGYFWGTTNFGGGDLVSGGTADIFIAKLDVDGLHEWSQGFGDVEPQVGYSVATDASGDVFATGDFVGTVSFGGGDLSSAGLEDIFLAKFSGIFSAIGETPQDAPSISVYPNPFNPYTTIQFTIPWRGRVVVGVYDARGAHVTTLVDEDASAGAYSRAWDGTDADGERVGSGVYFARVRHASGTKSYKMVLLK